MKAGANERKVSRLLKTLGQPVRLQILQAIGDGEACVCHLEAMLGLRQAYLSQHLMALRKAKILQTRREGRYIYYQLQNRALLDLVRLAEEIAGVPAPERPVPTVIVPVGDCICPNCSPIRETV